MNKKRLNELYETLEVGVVVHYRKVGDKTVLQSLYVPVK